MSCDPMNAPVSPNYAPFSSRRLPSLQRPGNQLCDCCPIVRVNQILESHSRLSKATGRQTIHRFHFRRPCIHSRPNVPFKSSDTGNLLGQSQSLLTCAKSLLRDFAPRDIRHHTHNTQHLAVLVKMSATVPLYPDHRTIW